MYGDCLILIHEIADYAFGEDVERSAEENIVCGRVYDVDLEVESDLPDGEWYIAS